MLNCHTTKKALWSSWVLNTKSLQKIHDCAAISAVGSTGKKQQIEKNHGDHSHGQVDGGYVCVCVCNPSVQLDDGNTPLFDKLAARLLRPLKDAMLASITFDTDDPPNHSRFDLTKSWR
jgi:hypothetical protein